MFNFFIYKKGEREGNEGLGECYTHIQCLLCKAPNTFYSVDVKGTFPKPATC